MLGYYQYEDKIVCRDSSLGLASRYGLYGPGIEFWRGHRYKPVPGSTQPPIE